MMKARLLGLTALLTLVATGASAAPKPPAPSRAPAAKATLPPAKAEDRVRIASEYMKYDRKAKMALATGSVVITQAETTIRTAEVQFDQAAKVSSMNQPVNVVQQKPGEPRTTLDSQRMQVFHKEKRLIAEQQVRLVRGKDPKAKPKAPTQKEKVSAAIRKEDTVIDGDKLEYWTQKKDAKFDGHVIVRNDQKKAWGDHAFVDNAKQTITLDGNVRVVQINGNWLVKEGIVEADRPDETRDEALRERATLTSDHLVIDQRTNDAVATGAVVRVEQKGRVATSRKAVFSDSTHTITLTDTVRIQQANGDWLTAAKAVFHTDSEVFEAFSGGQTQVQTEFAPPAKGSPKPAASPRVQMEFDVRETQ